MIDIEETYTQVDFKRRKRHRVLAKWRKKGFRNVKRKSINLYVKCKSPNMRLRFMIMFIRYRRYLNDE